jgi:hypothetical protein
LCPECCRVVLVKILLKFPFCLLISVTIKKQKTLAIKITRAE